MIWSSYEEHTKDALVPEADEGRSKLRKALGSRLQTLIQRSPNGATIQNELLELLDKFIVQ
jgi:hypothetical protein